MVVTPGEIGRSGRSGRTLPMAPSAWFTHESQGRGSLWTAGVSVERAETMTRMAGETPTIVLVHGAWADATGFDPDQSNEVALNPQRLARSMRLARSAGCGSCSNAADSSR